MAAPTEIRLNLGGEAEEPGVINQQPEWLAGAAHWASAGLAPLIAAGEPFLFCSNLDLPFPNESVGEVATNNVPVDLATWLGPGVQSSEIRRILISGGTWRHNGVAVFTKP